LEEATLRKIDVEEKKEKHMLEKLEKQEIAKE
jgi:hypothetical protein